MRLTLLYLFTKEMTSKYVGFCNAAQAETSAATDTLYGCFALQRYSMMLNGNAP